jgi:hypothetical protein
MNERDQEFKRRVAEREQRYRNRMRVGNIVYKSGVSVAVSGIGTVAAARAIEIYNDGRVDQIIHDIQDKGIIIAGLGAIAAVGSSFYSLNKVEDKMLELAKDARELFPDEPALQELADDIEKRLK